MATTSGLRTRWAAIGAAVAITLGAAGLGSLNIANADVSSGDRPVFIPINPCRLVDTRPGELTVGPKSTPIGPEQTITVTAHGANGECTGASTIPTDALSLSLNVTAVGPTSNTFLTFWGDGPNPGTSNLNPRAGGAPTPNSVNTPLSTAGTFNIFNNRGNVNVIVDVNGYYAHHNHDDRYVQKPTEISLVPAAFLSEDGDVGSWERGSARISRTPTAGNECIVAAFDIPDGVEVSGANMTYIAYDGADDIRIYIEGIRSRTGAFTLEQFGHDVAEFVGDLPVTPEGDLGGGVAGSQRIDIIDLELDPDSSLVDGDSFNYVAQICSNDRLIIFGFHIELEPST